VTLTRPIARPIASPIASSVTESDLASTWSPLDIASCFLLFDPTDISTLFQDTAATSPVTTSGQSVAAWRDKTSNATLFTQATAGNRPAYDVTDGRPSVYWNGVATRWLAATVDFTNVNAVTICTAMRCLTTTSNKTLFIHNGTSAPSFEQVLSTTPAVTAYSRGTGTARSGTVAMSAGAQTRVITTFHRITTALCRASIDNTTGTDVTLGQGTGNYANADTRIGTRWDAALTHCGNIYALAVFTSILTGDDLTRTKQWMADKAGVTL